MENKPNSIERGPEALKWLQDNLNPAGFASNRFTMSEAIEFVENLYALGASKIIVPDEMIKMESCVGLKGEVPYADGLTVFLPKDRQKAEAAARVCLAEIESEGFLRNEEDDAISIEDALPAAIQSEIIVLWWD